MANSANSDSAIAIRRAMDAVETLGQGRYFGSKEFHDKYKPARLAALQRELDALEGGEESHG